MLGRTANGLFWTYRYLERAENTARLVETGQRMALTRAQAGKAEWGSVLETVGAREAFLARHGEIGSEAAVDWLLRNGENPASVLAMVKAARHNARMVRTALTPEVWEAMNGAYMDLRTALARKVAARDLPEVLSLIHRRAALIRGTTLGTMLRNDIFNFIRLGLFIERGDFTARLLDVKYYVLLPSVAAVGSSLDNVQWETILRAAAGVGGFRMLHGARAGPREIVQFLVLERRMPRSLTFCAQKIADNLRYLADDYGTEAPALTRAEALQARLTADDVDAIFEQGLHEYLQARTGDFAGLGEEIERDYRLYA